MTFFHWVQQFPNSHLFNDPKTLMYHQEHGDFFLKYSSPTTILFFFLFEGPSFHIEIIIFLETSFVSLLERLSKS